MTLIRQFFESLLGILEKFAEEDAWALLCAAGVNYFVPENLLPKAEENGEVPANQAVSLLGALCLEVECPVWAWKTGTASASFLWKKEADMEVRDWIYLV